MQNIHRRAFTLVELLVVITIIGMLLAIMIPAVQAARERANCMKCNVQIRDHALATKNYESAKKHYPGFVSSVGNKRATWVVSLMPYEERRDVWNVWSDPNVAVGPTIYYAHVVCPSDPAESNNSNPLAYVANCGRPDVNFDDKPANGVFMNLFERKVACRDNDIADGFSTTLMFSENMQANLWTVNSSDEAERTVGMVWHPSETPVRRINGDKDGPTIAPNLDYARPSARHNGGVNVAYCDGHAEFLREDIDYKVYQQLMTPNSKQSDLPAAVKNYLLDEKDFR